MAYLASHLDGGYLGAEATSAGFTNAPTSFLPMATSAQELLVPAPLPANNGKTNMLLLFGVAALGAYLICQHLKSK